MHRFHANSSRNAFGLSLVLGLLLGACSGTSASDKLPVVPPGSSMFTVGGTLSGLPPGESVTLRNNGADDLTLTASGAFTFPSTVLDGAGYDVQVLTQPSGATCVVAGGAGLIAGANVTSVAVTCTVNPISSGALDPTFNAGGATPGIALDQVLATGLASSAGVDSVIDASGRILVTGHASGVGLDMALWRFHADGTLDTSFNAAGAVPGVATHNNAAGGNGTDQGRAITLDASGRILVTGISRGPFTFDMVIWRFNADGTLDTNFNASGPVPGTVVSFGAAGGNGTEQGDAILVDANGKILVAGAGASLSNNAFTDMVVWRYNADGTLDTSFNSMGAIPGIFSFNGASGGAGSESASALAIDATERIVVAGAQQTMNGVALAVWRLESSGVLDTTFDPGGGVPGRVSLDLSSDHINSAEDLVLDSSGRLVVAGYSGTNLVGDMVLLRFLADGSLDATFNAGGPMPGVVFHNGAAGGNAEDFGIALAADASGRLVVAGSSEHAAGDFDLAVWRYDASGTLDTAFHPSGAIPGVVTHHNAAGGADDDFGTSVALDALGNLVVAGTSVNLKGVGMTTTRMTLWRFVP